MKLKSKKIISVLLTLMIILLSACNGSGGGTGENNGNSNPDNNTSDGAKGRYLEDEVSLPEGVEYITAANMTKDGTLYLFSSESIHKSTDNGQTWEAILTDLPIYTDPNTYLESADMNSSGEMVLKLSTSNWSEENPEDYSSEEKYVKVDPEGKATEFKLNLPAADRSNNASDNRGTQVTDADRNEQDSDEPMTDQNAETNDADNDENSDAGAPDSVIGDGNNASFDYDNYISNIKIADNGHIFVMRGLGDILEIDPAIGDVLHSYGDGYSMDFYLDGNNLFYYDILEEEMVMFDTNEKKQVDVAELDQVVADSLGTTNSYYYPTLVFSGNASDESYYYVTGNGLYRYTPGTTTPEQLINGNLTSLANPEYSFSSLMNGKDNTYMLVASDNSGRHHLLNYVYSAEASATPSTVLKVYSLEDSTALRQAISNYQKKNPDVYLQLEIGMSGEDGMTASDAIKALNTEIMTGNGPDIIMLDGMPLDSYIEKNLLADISDVVNEVAASEELFENILSNYQSGDTTYAIPLRFGMPIISASEDIVNQISDLDTLVETIEKLAKENKGKVILNQLNTQSMAQAIYETYSAALQKEDGTLDEEALKKLLDAATRIYAAQNESKPMEENEFVMYGAQEKSLDAIMSLFTKSLVHLYTMWSPSDFSGLLASNVVLDGEIYKEFSGNEDQLYIPFSIMGVSAKSESLDEAKDFIKTMLSRESQASSSNGFPVNKAALDDLIGVYEYGENFGTAGLVVSTEDEETGELGQENEVTLEYNWPAEEEFAALKKQLDTLDTPVNTDQTIQDVVVSEMMNAMTGTSTVDEAASNVLSKINIYLAE